MSYLRNELLSLQYSFLLESKQIANVCFFQTNITHEILFLPLKSIIVNAVFVSNASLNTTTYISHTMLPIFGRKNSCFNWHHLHSLLKNWQLRSSSLSVLFVFSASPNDAAPSWMPLPVDFKIESEDITDYLYTLVYAFLSLWNNHHEEKAL